MQKFYVYKIINKVNGKIYIGKSVNPSKRWARHVYVSKTNKSGYKQLLLHRAISKYGQDNFQVEIIAEYDVEADALCGETIFIKQFRSNDLSVGYNLTEGGEGTTGYKLTDEHKKQISIKNSGTNNGMYGHTQTSNDRKLRGTKISETKKNNPTTPRPVSEKTIEKLKLAVKEKSSQKLDDAQKDLIIELYNSGNYLKRDLATRFNVEEKTIRYILRYWIEVKNNKPNYLTDEQKDRITSLYLSKQYTKRQISDLLQISLNRVVAAIRIYQNKVNKSTY
jgi:group I intron endonuclease